MLAHPLAQPDKGSGIAMICTFGDVTDIIWWRELDLPNRTILGQDGRILAEAPDVIESDAARRRAYAELAGKTVFSAKKAHRRAAARVRARSRASRSRSRTP